MPFGNPRRCDNLLHVCSGYPFWGEQTGKDRGFIDRMRKNGSLHYRKASPDASVAGLASRAVSKLFSGNDIDRRSIDLIVFTHTLPYSFPSAPVSIVQTIKAEYGLDNAAGCAIDQQACASVQVALRVIASQMSANPDLNTVLFIAADKVLGEDYRCLGDRAILTDSASAFIVARNAERNVIRGMATHFDARYYNGIDVSNQMANWHDQNYRILFYRVIKQAIERAGLLHKDIRKILPPNYRLLHAMQIAKLLKMEPQVLLKDNIADIGHAFNADTAINLIDAARDPANVGGNVVSFATGSYGCFSAPRKNGRPPTNGNEAVARAT